MGVQKRRPEDRSGQPARIQERNPQRALNTLRFSGKRLRASNFASFAAFEALTDASILADQLGISPISQAEAILGLDQSDGTE